MSGSGAIQTETRSEETVDPGLRALAERRLKQIAEVLALPADHFMRVHEAAKQALDGAHHRILSDQERRAAEAFPHISDALLRARVVALMGALADDEKPDPTA